MTLFTNTLIFLRNFLVLQNPFQKLNISNFLNFSNENIFKKFKIYFFQYILMNVAQILFNKYSHMFLYPQVVRFHPQLTSFVPIVGRVTSTLSFPASKSKNITTNVARMQRHKTACKCVNECCSTRKATR